VTKESRIGVMSLERWDWMKRLVHDVGAVSVRCGGSVGASGGMR
jgi:hypothetical protein